MHHQQDFFVQSDAQAPFVIKNATYYRGRGRRALASCFWYAVLACLIASLLGGVVDGGLTLSISSSQTSTETITTEQFYAEMRELIEVLRTRDLGLIFAAYPIVQIGLIAVGIGVLLGLAFGLFVSSPIKLGYQRYQLCLLDGENSKDLTLLFRYFKVSYGKSILLSALYGLLSFVCSIPVLAASLGMLWVNRAAFIGILTGDPSEHHILGVLASAAVILLASLVTAVLGIYLNCRYRFCFMILAEYPELSAVDALRNSAHLMRGNKWRFFCLQLSFIGWTLLAALLTAGFGMVVVVPYMQASYAAFYDEIANRVAARETEFPSLDPDDYRVD